MVVEDCTRIFNPILQLNMPTMLSYFVASRVFVSRSSDSDWISGNFNVSNEFSMLFFFFFYFVFYAGSSRYEHVIMFNFYLQST